MSATTGDGGERKGDGESEPTDTGQPSSEAAEQQPGHEQEQGNRTAHDAKSQRQDATGTQKPQGNPLQSGQGPSMAEQAGHLAGSAMRNVHENSRHNPLYLGMAIAFGVASLGAAFSTFPIFISLPVAGVLLGISVWLMGHVGVISLKSDQTPRRHGRLLRTATIGNLVGAQIVVTDVFLFTRLGSVAPGQSSMVVAWLIATALESLGAAIIVAADLFHRH